MGWLLISYGPERDQRDRAGKVGHELCHTHTLSLSLMCQSRGKSEWIIFEKNWLIPVTVGECQLSEDRLIAICVCYESLRAILEVAHNIQEAIGGRCPV